MSITLNYFNKNKKQSMFEWRLYVIPDERLSKLEIGNFIKAAKAEQKQHEILNDFIEHQQESSFQCWTRSNSIIFLSQQVMSSRIWNDYQLDNINPQNEKGESALVFAAWRWWGQMNIVRFFVDRNPKKEIIAVSQKWLSPIFLLHIVDIWKCIYVFLVDDKN